jgi:hypothetical protein
MRKIFSLCVLLFIVFTTTKAQTIPTPLSHFGFNIGDNYHLATYTQTAAYFKKLAAASNKVKLQVIGKTEEGRDQYMVIVSDPSNIKQLEKYKTISQKLARAEGLSDEEAKQLAK